MQISGRLIIVCAFALALAMSGGAWWYHYSQVRQAAAFWGQPGGRLIVRAPEITFYELIEPGSEPSADEAIAGRAVASSADLSDKPGLVHLRHVFYADANFVWAGRKREPVDGGDWGYALRFAEDDQEVVVLLRRDFERVGKLVGDEVDALPSPRISRSVRQYLTDVGALKAEAKDAAKPQAAER